MSTAIFWHRRDLRISDNAGLYQALKSGYKVQPIFIFDKSILDKLPKQDKRVEFIHRYIIKLQEEYTKIGTSLRVYHGFPIEVWREIIVEFNPVSVFTNHDYEPYAKNRDQAIEALLISKEISLNSYKDQCIFEKSEVTKDDGLPYTVFTPYANKWKAKLQMQDLESYPTETFFKNFNNSPSIPSPNLADLGFEPTLGDLYNYDISPELLHEYGENRNIPSINGTSRISVHLRFGTVSIRHLARLAKKHSEVWLNELIWRDFYMMILWHFPNVDKAFKPAYDKIVWRNRETEFQAWCEGKTGYPIVDAGMRELNETGFMHNRVRMIVASFLTKHLLVDWRWGEAYFAEKLLDFELSSNNGGWQWAASSGCDAAPYFRVFSPEEQTKKFDPKGVYIRKWVKEIDELTYPQPIVEHKFARQRVLETYKLALRNKE